MSRIKNLIGFATLVALGVALFVQQKRTASLEAEFAAKYDRDHFGSRAAIETSQLLSISKRYFKHEPDKEFSEFLIGELVYSVLNCAECERAVDGMIGPGYSAYLGTGVLDLLGCKKASDFFQIAKTCESLRQNDAELYPEIYHLDSVEHRRLSTFVQRALENDSTWEGVKFSPACDVRQVRIDEISKDRRWSSMGQVVSGWIGGWRVGKRSEF